MKKKTLSVTVGIPTYVGGASLVRVVNTLLTQKGVGDFPIIIAVDANPLDKKTKQLLKNKRITIIENKNRTGQMGRLEQIVKRCKTAIIVFAQDDLVIDPHALKEILAVFSKNPSITMVSTRERPLNAITFFERIVHVGVAIVTRVHTAWNNGDNYLHACGRCLAFKTAHAKKFRFPKKILCSDAYFYFANKKLGGTFRHAQKALYSVRTPMKLHEHLKQSKKFQLLAFEMKKYAGVDLNKDYPMPYSLTIKATLIELVTNPVCTLLYFGVLFYTRFLTKNMYSNAAGYWDTDTSTKHVLYEN